MRVVERPDGKLELVGVVYKGLEIGNRVAVRVDMDLATERRSKSLPVERLRQVFVQVLHANGLGLVAPIILALDQGGGLLERVSKVEAFAHAAKGPPVDTAMHPLGILSARHLHEAPVAVWVCQQVFGTNLRSAVSGTNGVLDGEGLAADAVAGAWENERGCDAARFDDFDLVIQRINGVDGSCPRRNVIRHLVDVGVSPEKRQRVDTRMAVHVDDAGGQLAARSIEDLGVVRERL